MDNRYHYLRAKAGSLLVEALPDGPVRVLHWGEDLGRLAPSDPAGVSLALVPPVLQSGSDHPVVLGVLRENAAGYLGRPAIAGHRDGAGWSPLFRLVEAKASEDRLEIAMSDPEAKLALTARFAIDAGGAFRIRYALTNLGQTPYTLDELSITLPLPQQAQQRLDFSGRWNGERNPQVQDIGFGTWLRESREGRAGHDAPIGLVAMTEGTGFRHGEAWAISLAWSGNLRQLIERRPDGFSQIGAGELLMPGEVCLAPGETYETPELVAVYSDTGLDGMSAAFHASIRNRPDYRAGLRPRPVTANSWEAVYFDHDLDRLKALADRAAAIGVERFVLDDGWFHRRSDDLRGLGDWTVDAERWAVGLDKLIDHVRGLGMDFGLWVEPEMVNPDSDVYRAHPDWVLATGGRLPVPWRHQQVLDLSVPDAYEYILGALDDLLRRFDITYFKWDHNRPLVDAGHGDRAGTHSQTLAAYRLFDELRRWHPRLEIENCSSGGGRVDLGIAERTDRVWPSDTLDPLERQRIQRWTGLFIPPEMMGADVASAHSHTTARTHALSFRAITALFGHMGVQLNLLDVAEGELQDLAAWIAFYKAHRAVLHAGEVVRIDYPDPSALAHGVVAEDRSAVLFAYVQLSVSVASPPSPLRFSGLDRGRRYHVRHVAIGAPAAALQRVAPPWMNEPLTLSGAVLEAIGIAMPVLMPEQAILIELKAAEA